MLKQVLQFVTLLVLAAVAPLSMAQRTPLLVYTALETDQLKAFKDSIESMVKDVEIRWVRDSTGVITAKLLAEKANPQADMILGLAATSLLVLEQEGMLTPYAPKGVEKLDPRFVDSKKPPMWVGMDVWGATICFNTVEAKKRNLPKPESWKDRLKPVYKGQITMPHPASSGTGFLDVTAWLQLYGEAEGWKYMDALHENIAQYVHSGSKPCRQAGAGDIVDNQTRDPTNYHVAENPWIHGRSDGHLCGLVSGRCDRGCVARGLAAGDDQTRSAGCLMARR